MSSETSGLIRAINDHRRVMEKVARAQVEANSLEFKRLQLQGGTVTPRRFMDDLPVPEEMAFHDEETLTKVRNGIRRGLDTAAHNANNEDGFITDIISELQNEGILFRERKS